MCVWNLHLGLLSAQFVWISYRAIKEGKGQEALQHYNAALTAELPGSAAFVAVLFANRAAAHQSLGQATHAVADCLRATALSPAYSKVRSFTFSIWWKSGVTFVSTSKLPLNPLLSWTKPCTECCDGQGKINCGIYIGCFAETCVHGCAQAHSCIVHQPSTLF